MLLAEVTNWPEAAVHIAGAFAACAAFLGILYCFYRLVKDTPC